MHPVCSGIGTHHCVNTGDQSLMDFQTITLQTCYHICLLVHRYIYNTVAMDDGLNLNLAYLHTKLI